MKGEGSILSSSTLQWILLIFSWNTQVFPVASFGTAFEKKSPLCSISPHYKKHIPSSSSFASEKISDAAQVSAQVSWPSGKTTSRGSRPRQLPAPPSTAVTVLPSEALPASSHTEACGERCCHDTISMWSGHNAVRRCCNKGSNSMSSPATVVYL